MLHQSGYLIKVSNLCSCHRNRLYCVAACNRCHGEWCENTEAPPLDSDNETEELLMGDPNERNIFDSRNAYLDF